MKKPTLSVEKRIGILLLSIDPDVAAQVMRSMSEETLHVVTRAMKELQDTRIDEETVADVKREFADRLAISESPIVDAEYQAEAVLERAFGAERGAEVSRKTSEEILERRPFAMFESLEPADLAALLTEEHPQIAAVFLAHLAPARAGRVLQELPEGKRPDLVTRVASLDRTPPDVVKRVLEVMRQKVKNLGLTSLRAEPKAWLKTAATILNNMGGAERDVLESIEEGDARLAEQIRDEMFTFDDLGSLDKRAMQRVLGQVDTRELAVALKAAPPEVESNVFRNLSKRAGAMVQEERETLGPMPLSDVRESQRNILVAVRDLMERGELNANEVEEEVV